MWASETAGAGTDVQTPLATTIEIGHGAVVEVGRRGAEPDQCRPRRRHPERGAFAGRIGPRCDPELAHPVADPVTVGRHGDPHENAIDDGVVGVVRRHRGGRHHRESDRGGSTARGRDRYRSRTGVVAQHDGLDATVEHVGEGAGARAKRPSWIVGRQGQLEQEVGQRILGVGVAAGACLGRRRREHDLARSGADVTEDVETLRHRPRQDDRDLGAPDRDRRHERRELADGPALVCPRRVTGAHHDRGDAAIEQEARHRQRVRGLGTRPGRAPAAPTRGRDQPRERPLRAGDDGDAAGSPAANLEPRQLVAMEPGDADRVGEPGVGRASPFQEKIDGRIEIAASRDRQAADQAPCPSGTADERDRDRGGAMVDREECVRLRRHRQMLPGVGRTGRPSISRRARSTVPDELVVELFEPRDEQLDPGVVGEDLGRRGEVATEHAAQDRVEEQHRVGPERAVRPAGLEEMDGGRRQSAQLDLPRDLFDEVVALFLGRLEREAHLTAPAWPAMGASPAMAIWNAW